MAEATWLITEQACSLIEKGHALFNEILFEGMSRKANTMFAARLMALTQCGREVFKHDGIKFKCMRLNARRMYRAGAHLANERCSETSHTGAGIEQ